jgi:capsular polysaccharide transport system permease protein
MTEEIIEGTSERGALAHSGKVAKKLSITARKLRFSTSNRSQLFKIVGLRPRVIERIFAGALIVVTLIFFVLPNVVSVFYYGYLASDQFQSETRFVVRSSTPALGKDQLAKVSGIPSAKILQDTQIVTNFINSNEILNSIADKISLTKIFGGNKIDAWARLDDDSSSEKRLSYWKKMVSTSINAGSGIVTVRVRAFSPADAQNVLQLIVAASEEVVNDINNRIWKDVISSARNNLENATDQLQKARVQLQAGRNQSGILSVTETSAALSDLIGSVQRDQIALKQKYNSQLVSVSADAPQMKVMQRQIESMDQQIKELSARIAGQDKSVKNLADVSVDMSQWQVEEELAERQFAASVKTLEQVQFVSKQQLIYLDAFLSPTLPDSGEYPRRAFWVSCIFGVTMALWGLLVGSLFTLRNFFS